MPATLRSVRHPLSCLLLAVTLLHATGCGDGWHPITTPAPEIGSTEPGTVLRFRTANGTMVALRDPVVRGDSIVGARWDPGIHIRGDSTRAIPSASVEIVGWRKHNAGGNAGAGLALLGLALLVGLAAAASGASLGPQL